MLWQRPQDTFFTDADNQQRDMSAGVVLGRSGVSLVGATSQGGSASFFAAVDGVFNIDIKDYPDASLVLTNLSCSIHGGDCAASPAIHGSVAESFLGATTPA